MTKSTKILIIIMSIILIIFGVLLAVDIKPNKDDSDSKKIAELSYQINELRKQKEACFDALTYEESKSSMAGFTKPCGQWDEQIMILREQENELKSKSYEGGLDASR